MKKTLLSAMLVFAGLTAQAQLANGSIAPDFTATDINGVQHHLYEYLDAGKTVIIDISATWCGPCWAYHGTEALADLHESYGMGGSEETVVLFIEGDPGTSVESIYGTNIPSDTRATRGDWTQHSPYPIIDDTNGDISVAYNLQYFPTVYMICPNYQTTELTQPTAVELRNQINSNCAAETMLGINDKGRFTDLAAGYFCQADGVYKAKVKNLGTNRMLSATVVLKENGNILSTKQYSSSTGIAQYGTTTITFDSSTFTANAAHTVEVTSINGMTPPYPALLNEEVDIEAFHAAQTNRELEVRIHTDAYPGEISWKIRTASGTVVASGGPYTPGPASAGGAGGPDANTMISTMVTLPEGDDCYKIELRDSYRDGWTYSLTADEVHGVEIYNGDTQIYEYLDGNFGASIMLDAALITSSVAATPGIDSKHFAVYPNPTKGILNFTTQEPVNITIMDLTGKIVHTAKNITDGNSINIGGLQKGMYVAQIKGATTQKTEKIIIE
ncbi:hypothetical protein Q765_17575 [Flavobacterium rivuli WB 3.3-2 = DSM 21788]|uniref:Thioredoxin domain-containing protein n=1 Tax=Flavobacterium rivuli WB 3.3-2 = DSM 21788 TaxID=1121895 RepID=A0A0A2LXU4_9FLAO|nr:T9SS type A sorting domain-containing protein [Flavobacterium rivuli]KGO85177.1 hypothetical protein Q765_17575 [Flavobacterium rivuli WB 3.3-2 = DSM 21788]